MSAWLRRHHLWLGLLAALPMLLWGLSGLLHPIMNRLQVQPATTAVPVAMVSGFSHEQLQTALPLARLLPLHGITAIRDAQLLRDQGRLLWQVMLPGLAERRYFDAHSGQALPDFDRVLAVRLARHFAGAEQRGIRHVQLLTVFTDDYPAVNRLLPVYRVDFTGDDGLRGYVETAPMRLATINDDRKAIFQALFRNLHSWAFIENEGLRDGVMSGFLLAGLAAAGGGISWYVLGRRRGARNVESGWRRWHRRLGMALVVVTAAFTVSALLHLWLIHKSAPATMLVNDRVLAAAQLQLPPQVIELASNEQVALVNVAGEPYFRLSPMADKASGGELQHHHATNGALPRSAGVRYVSARDGRERMLGEQVHARMLAHQYSSLPDTAIVGISPVQQFGGEYGFINKRLPVLKVDYATPDHLSVYVEPSSGAIAATIRDRDRVEGYSFANLHKWHFLDFAGKDVRDLASGLAVLGMMLSIGAGLGLYVQRRRILRARRVMTAREAAPSLSE